MSSSGADWGDGYVTDTAYLPGYYHHQSPLHLNLACLLAPVGFAVAACSALRAGREEQRAALRQLSDR